jgi:hypothetical protein
MTAPLGQIFADLWQLGNPAKPYISFLEKKMRTQEIATLRGVIARTRRRI